MGVRLYSPVLGRFLQSDPIPGGSSNPYDYAGQDPINTFDLDGKCWRHCHWGRWARRAAQGALHHIGLSASVCAGYVFGGCATIGVSYYNGFYAGTGFSGHNRFAWGGSIGGGFTWASTPTSNHSYCAIAGPVSACREQRGRHHRTYGAEYGVGAFVGVIAYHQKTFRPWDM